MNFKLHRHGRVLIQRRFFRSSHHLRAYSSTLEYLTASPSIYVSNSTNPYFNLTLEDWLFKNKRHDKPLLLLYRDDPCVVIGRNQNPWKEVNLQLAELRRVPFLRRRSGGGTVYHDLGNTNYSIHLPRSEFDRSETAQLVLRAVSSLGVPASLNDRNDVCSAYKIVSKRAYHHGTMLISTRLDTLGNLLHTSKETMITKGVASVRSPVQNLQRFDSSISHERFVNAAVNVFKEKYDIDEEIHYVEENDNILNVPAIRTGMDELKSWDWMYGQTPEFTYTVTRLFDWGEANAEITSKHGVIRSCKVNCGGIGSETLKRMNEKMQGLRYGFIKEFEENDEDSRGEDGSVISDPLRIQGIWNWIREETSS